MSGFLTVLTQQRKQPQVLNQIRSATNQCKHFKMSTRQEDKFWKATYSSPRSLIFYSHSIFYASVYKCWMSDSFSPSVSVALSTSFETFLFRLEGEAVSSRDVGSNLPVPIEMTHCSGVSGHRSRHSWIAIAAGLLVNNPPSWWTQSPSWHST